jgi:thiol-disulfide isomerase/thioredoxin
MTPSDERRGRWQRSRTLRFGTAFAAAAIIALSVVLALTYSGNPPSVPALNFLLPRIDFPNLISGRPAISTASLEGRAVVLNFWGSWCPPCRAEMPALEAVHRELGNKVLFVGVDEYDSRGAAISFLHAAGVTYPVGFDANASVARAFDLPGTPTTYFISRGRELDFSPGQLTERTLRANLREWFGV